MSTRPNTPYRVIDGKFYRGEELVPPLFGNREQIVALEHSVAVRKAYMDREYRARIHEDVETEEQRFYMEWECYCGRDIAIESKPDVWFNKKQSTHCPECRQRFWIKPCRDTEFEMRILLRTD